MMTNENVNVLFATKRRLNFFSSFLQCGSPEWSVGLCQSVHGSLPLFLRSASANN